MAEFGYDKKDPINAGVKSYELVGCSAGVTVHRVVYECPISGESYSFVTSLTNVPPGLIAYLYKTRWDIEYSKEYAGPICLHSAKLNADS